ncbi:MAG: glucose-6-phosphate isomerase, partial [Sulfuricella sp.]|nr:glucose-6-phosphate isomerase [Sulfuricella sp.]
MSVLTRSKPWQALMTHQKALAKTHLRELFSADPKRFDKFSLKACGILLDYSKNRIDSETMTLLAALARKADVEGWREKMFVGDKINFTENRAVLHTALRNRSSRPVMSDGHDVMPEVRRVLGKMREFSESVRSGQWKGYTGKPVTDIVNIGIGG